MTDKNIVLINISYLFCADIKVGCSEYQKIKVV